MCFVCGTMSCAKLSLHWLYTSSQAKGTKTTLFLTRKEQSGLSTLGVIHYQATFE